MDDSLTPQDSAGLRALQVKNLLKSCFSNDPLVDGDLHRVNYTESAGTGTVLCECEEGRTARGKRQKDGRRKYAKVTNVQRVASVGFYSLRIQAQQYQN